MIYLILYVFYLISSLALLEDLGGQLSIALVILIQATVYGVLLIIRKKHYDFKKVKAEVNAESDLAFSKRFTFLNYHNYLFLLLVYLASQLVAPSIMAISSSPFAIAAFYLSSILDYIFAFTLMYPLVVESNNGYKKLKFTKMILYAALAVVSTFIFNSLYSNLIGFLNIAPASGDSSINQQLIEAMIVKKPLQAFLMITFSAAIMEEWIFRALGFRSMLKKSRFMAYFVTFVVFSIPHLLVGFNNGSGLSEFIFMPLYGSMGLIFAYLYEKTESIYTPMLAHLINNLLAFVMIWYS